MARVTVIDTPDKPVPKEILAEAIVRMSAAAEALSKSGLNEEAIVVLVSAHTMLPKREIRLVLQSLRDLRSRYCR